ncbi:MAG: hypothetical protein HRT55_14265 [Colwellia sp.]|uniref:LPS translocon maturation chaperone LptM n=1 Tax=Colwellia sp. TaxID=56799 RepID=UPI0025BFAA3A|nr:lipoprotein [Colwellia sp.]NQZ27469.1 hypothetical protein [Colwellia sp.]
MRTNRLRYLQQKLHRTLHIKSILLAILAAILFSACGIKGDLYQTPEQEVTEQSSEQDKVTKQRDESYEKPVTTLDEAEKNPAVQQPIAQATIPAVKQSTEQIKE